MRDANALVHHHRRSAFELNAGDTPRTGDDGRMGAPGRHGGVPGTLAVRGSLVRPVARAANKIPASTWRASHVGQAARASPSGDEGQSARKKAILRWTSGYPCAM